MLILGFQKMTLLDYPNKVASTVFTGGCNFRCPFCHNSALVTKIEPENSYDADDVLSYLNSRKGLIDGVCITGGEPLMQRDLKDFIKELKKTGCLVKLDTNGSSPDKLENLVGEKLVDYVAMDIKNSPEKYGETAGMKDFDLTPVKESVNFLISGVCDYEFRTTVVKEYHTINDVKKIAEFIHGAKKYFLQNFVDSGNLIKDGLHPVDKQTLLSMQREAEKILGFAKIRGV